MRTNEMAVFGVSEPEEMVYRHFLRHPGTRAEDLHLVLECERETARRALSRLMRLGLLRPGDAPESLTPADPETALARLTELRLQGLYQEIEGITRNGDILATLRAETDRTLSVQGENTRAPFKSIEQLDCHAIRPRIDDLTFFSREEIIAAVPGVRLLNSYLDSIGSPDSPAQRRGTSCRLVVLPWALDREPTATRLRGLVSRGARVKVARELTDHLVVWDGRVALMPQTPGEEDCGGLLVHGGALVAGLVELFETLWESAADLSVELRDPAGERPALSEAEIQVLNLMCTVGKDETGARGLGVSVRTYRRYIADVMRTLGASTRAQAALLARERGWI